MLENLRQALKEDLWKIIDNKEETNRNEKDFILFIFYMFLEKQEFRMEEVMKASRELKTKYEQVLEESKEMAIMGEPIKALKNIDKEFIQKLKPIIEKICLK